jgi:hypothetical protein
LSQARLPVPPVRQGGRRDREAPYTPKFGVAGTIPDNSLFEGGINISQLIGDVCLTSFLVETRSSQSTDAVLKDFTLHEFSVCGFEASKTCSAAVAASGGGLDVDFSGTVSNSGVGVLSIKVSDDMGDITDVCYDDAAPFDDCTAADTDAGESIVSGVATFNLLGGATAFYEGQYTVGIGSVTINGEGEAEATDTVTVEARLNPADVEPIATKTAMATCSTPVDGSVAISKSCNASINSAGDTLLVSVSGSGSNTGDVLIEDVSLSDSDAEVNGSLSILVNGNPATNGAFDLAPGDTYSFTASATESVLSHSDTMTVSGSNAFNGATITNNDGASCNTPATPSVTVSKDCSVTLDYSNAINTIQLKVGFSGQICNGSSVLALTGLTASDSDAGDLTLSKTTLAPSECINYSGSYLPSDTDGGLNLPSPGSASFSDTVTVNATGALGTGPVSHNDDATCGLCPE